MTQSPPNKSQKEGRISLILICAAYLLITVSYSVINPLFETPDEQLHFFTVVHIATTGTLPHVDANNFNEWMGQEAAQPPLYYLLGASLIAPIDTSEVYEQVWLNPFVWIGTAQATHNLNRAVHTSFENWPWQGYALAAHLLRGLSTLFGLGTLLCIYASARLLWPQQPQIGLIAMSIIAFLPQFNFIQSAISNDTLITFLCSFAVWQLLYLWFNQISMRRLLLLGITIGLAALTKNAGVLLLVFACGMLLLQTLRDVFEKNGRFSIHTTFQCLKPTLWQTAVFVILPVLLMTGWLWLRNHQLYGDWTATEPFIRIAGGDRQYTLGQVLRESGSIWTSFYAIFGWFNLRAPEWVYWVWNGIVAVAALGWGRKLIVNSRQSIVDSQLTTDYRLRTTDYRLRLAALLLAGWLLAVYTGLVLFMLRTEAAQGRLLFPAILPIALGLAYGLSRWRWTSIIAPALAFITTLTCLLFIIRPAYAQPPTVSQVPETAVSFHADMGQGLSLVGAMVETETAVPTDILTFTLFWQADQLPTTPPEFKLELIGKDQNNPLAAIHSYHGRGLFPASIWPLNEIIADRFSIRLQEKIDTPVVAQVFVRLVNNEDGTNHERVRIGQVEIEPTQWPHLSEAVLAQVGDGIELTAVSLNKTTAKPGEQLTVSATWQVTTPPQTALTTLIHLAEPGQPPIANGDSPPRAGTYPTLFWEAGELIQDQYMITIPDGLANGRYPLWIGMYDSETIVPLPIWVNGEMQPDGRFLIDWVTVIR